LLFVLGGKQRREDTPAEIQCARKRAPHASVLRVGVLPAGNRVPVLCKIRSRMP
jgi:hypothetical protein